ncbi:type II toxin-antitoxin system Phd/YefM family antitoxin [uncultured Sphaerotilus sp.]|uniref:type II toxin-antitoxin system Phd/YefM family antitoxin n=1 Tax=uncultured Sphaerotilus sp. TaxID=474984 RepID=UPI0030CA30F5
MSAAAIPAIAFDDAQQRFGQLIDQVGNTHESVLILGRAGQPVARLVPLEPSGGIRLGLAKGRFRIPEPSDELDAEIAAEFDVETLPDSGLPATTRR